MNPAAAAALLEEGDAAYARCKQLGPPDWASVLKVNREVCSLAKPIIELHMKRSPNAWQLALHQEAHNKAVRRAEYIHARFGQGQPRCDGCGQPAMQLKWCACRLKRYCGKECQRRDFPAHKAECKKARGVA